MDTQIYQLARQAGALLLSQSASVGVAESCTGGWIAQALTAVPGSSGWFELGLVTYSNAMKSRYLGVPQDCLDGAHAPGAVSERSVRHMAAGVLLAAGSTYAVASSGIAGPDGGSADKPVGTVWLAWGTSVNNSVELLARVYQFAGDRESVRRQTVILALKGLIDCCRVGGRAGAP